MTYEWTVSLRYLKSRRRQTFISMITLISVGGVAVGVMVLIVVLAVMSGFETSLKEKILGVNSHIWLLPLSARAVEGYRDMVPRLQGVPHVTRVTPFTTNEVMLMTEGRVAGTIVRGIDPAQKEFMTDFTTYFHGQDLRQLLEPEGALPAAPREQDTTAARRGIVLGSELARTLLAVPGQTVLVNSPLGMLTPAGILPNMQRFTVTATFETGMYEYDAKLAFMSLGNAQAFFDMGDTVHGLEVKVDDIYRVREVAEALRDVLGPGFWTRDWMEMNGNLFAALRQERVIMFIILVLIILVAAFNIVSTLVMLVMEKQADIAILKAMGARRSSISKIFILEGVIIGGCGTVLGGIAGLILTWNLPAISHVVERLLGIQFLPPNVYPIDKLPAHIDPQSVGIIVVVAMFVSFLATLYPAWNASKLDPVVALRYE